MINDPFVVVDNQLTMRTSIDPDTEDAVVWIVNNGDRDVMIKLPIDIYGTMTTESEDGKKDTEEVMFPQNSPFAAMSRRRTALTSFKLLRGRAYAKTKSSGRNRDDQCYRVQLTPFMKFGKIIEYQLQASISIFDPEILKDGTHFSVGDGKSVNAEDVK